MSSAAAMPVLSWEVSRAVCSALLKKIKRNDRYGCLFDARVTLSRDGDDDPLARSGDGPGSPKGGGGASREGRSKGNMVLGGGSGPGGERVNDGAGNARVEKAWGDGAGRRVRKASRECQKRAVRGEGRKGGRGAQRVGRNGRRGAVVGAVVAKERRPAERGREGRRPESGLR